MSSSRNGIRVQLVGLRRRCQRCIPTCSSKLLQLGMRPPHEFYNEENRHTMWRLNKAVYGLGSSAKLWQYHIAHILTVTLELVRCATESNEYISFAGETTALALEKIKCIPGNLPSPSFDFTVLTTNPHDAVMTTLFLMSSGKLATANYNRSLHPRVAL